MRHHPLPLDPEEDFVGEDDELHLVDPAASREPVLDEKTIAVTVLNAFALSAFLVYWFRNDFVWDSVSVVLGVVAVAVFALNGVLALRVFQRVREHSLRMSRPEEFRDYANRLNSQEPVIHEKVAPEYRNNKFRLWPRDKPVHV